MSDIDSAVVAMLEQINPNGQAHPVSLLDGGSLPQFIYKCVDTPYRQLDHNGVQASFLVMKKFLLKVYDSSLFDSSAETKILTMGLQGFSGTVSGVEIHMVRVYGDSHDSDPEKTLFWNNFFMDVMYREE
jgi:hypothetical protein